MIVAINKYAPYKNKLHSKSSHMYKVQKIATVEDCPKLNRLMPWSCHLPAIERATAKQKQSAKPAPKAPKLISHSI